MNDPQTPAEAAGLPGQGPLSPPPQPVEEPPAPLRLILRPGGASVELTRLDTLIGRHSDADVRLALPDVSRRHCRVMFSDGCWQILDLNSLNGVFVNGNRVRQATLDQGDLIRIGGLTFEVEVCRLDSADVTLGQDAAANPDVLRRIIDALPPPGPESSQQRKAS